MWTITLSRAKTSGFSSRNLMSHVRAAVVVSWPAISKVNMLSFNCVSVSFSLLSSPCESYLLCFCIRDSKKSCCELFPVFLLEIIESNMAYILSRAWSDENKVSVLSIIIFLQSFKLRGINYQSLCIIFQFIVDIYWANSYKQCVYYESLPWCLDEKQFLEFWMARMQTRKKWLWN